MKIGDKVEVKRLELSGFTFCAFPSRYVGCTGVIVNYHSNGAWCVEFKDFDDAWFAENELILKDNFHCISDAVNYLISEGYEVTLSRKD